MSRKNFSMAPKAVHYEGSPMNRFPLIIATIGLSAVLFLAGCESKNTAQAAEAGTGPVNAAVEPDLDANNFKVEHSDRFPLATAGEHVAAP